MWSAETVFYLFQLCLSFLFVLRSFAPPRSFVFSFFVFFPSRCRPFVLFGLRQTISSAVYANEAKWYRESRTKDCKTISIEREEQNQLMMNKMVKYKYYADWILNTKRRRKKSCSIAFIPFALTLLTFNYYYMIFVVDIYANYMETCRSFVFSISFYFSSFLPFRNFVKFFESLYSNYSDFSYQAEEPFKRYAIYLRSILSHM